VKWRKGIGFKYQYDKQLPIFERVKLSYGLENSMSYLGKNEFLFLNLKHTFTDKINWDHSEHGKLWTYNLNYFEFLNQSDSGKWNDRYSEILRNYVSELPSLKDANEPFPTSLRIINWIKYFINHDVFEKQLLESLYSQLYILDDNKEYHLLGNHLLENGFALIFGGIFFQDKYLYHQGKSILIEHLEEQILNDGGHFELSPMYHCLMLHRVLDSINMLKINRALINNTLGNQDQFYEFMQSKAQKMCGWLSSMMYNDGSIPHFNDSTDGIALEPNKLLSYAEALGLNFSSNDLDGSGYRRLNNEYFDVIIKAGKIGPDYIPGHAHADSLSFESRIENQPFIIDIGISTYDKNAVRQNERSTTMHNTVNVKNKNSSDVWGGFRVGRRANTVIVEEKNNMLEAYHDGYAHVHKRQFILENTYLSVNDTTDASSANAVYHFHPDVILEKTLHGISANKVLISMDGAIETVISEYQYCLGFNKVSKAQKLTIVFKNNLTTNFYI